MNKHTFFIIISVSCLLLPKSACALTPQSKWCTLGGMVVGAILGVDIDQLVAAYSPHYLVQPPVTPKTVLEKIKYFYNKNMRKCRFVLFTIGGAVCGGLIGFTPFAPELFESKTKHNQRLCDEEIAEIHSRFAGIHDADRLTIDELALYNNIRKDLTVDNSWTDVFGLRHRNIQRPTQWQVLHALKEQLILNVKIKHTRKEQELKKRENKEKKTTVDPTYKCPICLESPTNPVCSYNCNHGMCTDCYSNFKNQQNGHICPVCRQE